MPGATWFRTSVRVPELRNGRSSRFPPLSGTIVGQRRWGEGPVVHGDHSAWCKHLDRFYGVIDAHREIATNGEKCDVQRMQAADELHVEKHARVTGMIGCPFFGFDNKTAGISRVDEVAVLGHRGAVQSLRQEEFTEWEDVIAADVHGVYV